MMLSLISFALSLPLSLTYTHPHTHTQLSALFPYRQPSCHVVMLSGCWPLSHMHNTHIKSRHDCMTQCRRQFSWWCNTSLVSCLYIYLVKWQKQCTYCISIEKINMSRLPLMAHLPNKTVLLPAIPITKTVVPYIKNIIKDEYKHIQNIHES